MSLNQKDDKPFTCPTASEEPDVLETSKPDIETPDWDFDDEFDGGNETFGRYIVFELSCGIRILNIRRGTLNAIYFL